jgi:hypothetical protein
MLSIAAEAAQAMLAQCTTMDVAILSGCPKLCAHAKGVEQRPGHGKL